MKLWRVDFTADETDADALDGSRFFFEPDEAVLRASQLEARGYLTDVYEEEIGEHFLDEVRALVATSQEQLPIEQIMAGICAPLPQAKRQLQEIIDHRGSSKARVAWEGR
jgi:hypothetical protein